MLLKAFLSPRGAEVLESKLDTNIKLKRISVIAIRNTLVTNVRKDPQGSD